MSIDIALTAEDDREGRNLLIVRPVSNTELPAESRSD